MLPVNLALHFRETDSSPPIVTVTALESAVDQHALFFLSSGESQRCVFALWRGLLVQRFKDDGSVEYEPVSWEIRCWA